MTRPCVKCGTTEAELVHPRSLNESLRSVRPMYCLPCANVEDAEYAASIARLQADRVHAVEAAQPASLESQLLTPGQLRNRPRPKHLIKGVLKLSSATWLIGAPGSYKSFVALDWAAHVAAGLEWRERKVEQREVLYVLAEGAEGFQDRVSAWERRHGTDLDSLLILPVPVQARGDDKSSVSAQWRELVTLVAKRKPGLVVLDTQARLSVGMEENSNSEMGVWVRAVDMIKKAADCCVLVVHHTGRAGGDARGASAIDGAQDAEWRVDKDKNLAFTLSCDKMKDGSDDAKWSFIMDVIDLGLDDDGDKISSLVIGQQRDKRTTEPAVEQVELSVAEGRSTDCYGVVHRVLDQLDPHRFGMTLAEVIREVKVACKSAKREPFKDASVRAALNHGKKQGATDNAGRRWRLTEPAEGLEDGLFGTVAATVADHGSDHGLPQRSATVDNAFAIPPLSWPNTDTDNGVQRLTTVN
ncbi:AAA family ATPase [Actinoplanes awajinensis]|uniref:AAA+ ATPase domain-containing protein n=1 Tax=Actinoplanes awajinensis subsp. mycoplanecinus TaxID=135947 RepID=A0A124G7B7_9ACTN|nr:AAA family ATPase [Actinoplanes awajinensis]KUL22346.1 hypothetical protein ADL15_48295 [Actinoplanes awajinensis subsp. mycoplanecinus]